MLFKNKFILILCVCATSMIASVATAALATTSTAAMAERNAFDADDSTTIVPVLIQTTEMASNERVIENEWQQQQQQEQKSYSSNAETSKGDLHLDELNFVATTPKIQTTSAPSR